MAQHDYIIANGTGASVRSDINGALAAIASNNSSASEPGTTYAYQWWADTTANILKLRNGSNTGWISIAAIAGANPGVAGVIPIGGIIMWSGTIATIPVGWGLCNGNTYGAITTPDLRNKFIIGAVVDAVAPGDLTATPHATIEGSNKRSGGVKDAAVISHTHTTDAQGSHSHGGGTTGGGAHGHNILKGDIGGNKNAIVLDDRTNRVYATNNGAGEDFIQAVGDHAHSITADGSHGHNIYAPAGSVVGDNQNLPPYYSLAYIMRVA